MPPQYVKISGQQYPGGYIYEHRLVAERMLGRPLAPDEEVHHVNGDGLDNRPENLQVVGGRAEHAAAHGGSFRKSYPTACSGCGCPVDERTRGCRTCQTRHIDRRLGRSSRPAASTVQTHCQRGHPFTEENTAWRNGGRWRVCRECARKRSRRHYHASKEAAA